MRKFEDAVIPSVKNEIRYLVGGADIEIAPREIFSSSVADFFDDLARELRGHAEAKKFPDVQTFAFWIRKSNYQRLRERMNPKQERMGRGLVFHIAPSNVPVNFAYSLAFGMMAGNVNIVRTSSKEFPQVDIICDCINKLIKEKHRNLQNQICIVKYEANKEITDSFSAKCDARVVWGGDDTVFEIRKSPLRPRAVEINFTDRYSFAVIDPEAVLRLDAAQLKKLALDFYYDTYLMDQQACTAPHMIFWKKRACFKEASERFWKAAYEAAKEKYSLEGIMVSEKFTELYRRMALETVGNFRKYGNILYVVTLDRIGGALDDYRGKFGLFYEYEYDDYAEFAHLMNDKMQTCAYLGIERKEIVDLIYENHLRGIDRIVPIGKTLDMDIIWDGYDVIGGLSRVVG